MKKYDVHIHTEYSRCSNNKLDKVLTTAKQRGLNGIVVCDHNTIAGALKLKRLNKDKNFEVIVGEEVSTDLGHVLLFYLKKSVKKGKVERVIKDAKKQGAICVLAHPYNIISEKIGNLIKCKDVRKTVTDENEHKVKLFDAVEGFNARSYLSYENTLARRLAKKYKKPMTGGSDSHFLGDIGNGWTEFSDGLNLREAILNGKTKIGGKRRRVIRVRLRSAWRMLFNKERR